MASLETRVGLDAAGRTRTLTDARGVVVMRARYDALGRRLHVESVDGGESRGLPDVSGAMIRSWNGRGIAVRTVHDELGRLTHLFVRDGAGPERLAERTLYGELLPDATDRNLRARPFRAYDAAGAVTTEALDFAGNVLRANRRLPVDPTGVADWSVLEGHAGLAEIEAAADALLDAEALTTTTEYDAFGRPTTVVTPDGSVATPAYDEAGLLGSVAIRLRGAAAATTFVADTAHNARGQRERVRFGNGVTSTYSYDPRSFRLSRIHSVIAGGAAAQDLGYTYDPVGNVVEVSDAAQGSLIFAGAPVDPVLRFEYDPLYRLVAAEGRELAGPDGQPAAADITRSAVPSAAVARRYRETYAYDPGGNITSMRHDGGAGWTRRYAYGAGSNRLERSSVPGDPAAGPFSASYAHDPRGNVTTMPHLAALGWDAKDRLTTVDLGGGGTVHYTYDSAGRRSPQGRPARRLDRRRDRLRRRLGAVQAADRRGPRRRTGDAPRHRRRSAHRDRGDRDPQRGQSDRRPNATDPVPAPQPSRLVDARARRLGRGRELRGVLPVRRHRVRRRAGQALPVRWPRTRRRNRVSTTAMRGITRRGSVAGSARTPPGWPTARTSTPTPVAIPPPTPTRQAPRADDDELPSQAYDALKVVGVGSSNPAEGGGRSIWDRIASALGSLWDAGVQRGECGMELAGRRRGHGVGLDQGCRQQGMDLDQGRRRFGLELDERRGRVGLGMDEGGGVHAPGAGYAVPRARPGPG